MTDISITCPVNSQENCLLVKFTGFFYAFPGFIFIFFLLLLNFFSFFKKVVVFSWQSVYYNTIT